jgi:hypothetical protein
MTIPLENLRTVEHDPSSMCKESRRFPTKHCNALRRLPSGDSQFAKGNLFRVSSQAVSLSMLESSIFPCDLRGRPLGRMNVDGVSSPNEMNRREAYPSQTCVTT